MFSQTKPYEDRMLLRVRNLALFHHNIIPASLTHSSLIEDSQTLQLLPFPTTIFRTGQVHTRGPIFWLLFATDRIELFGRIIYVISPQSYGQIIKVRKRIKIILIPCQASHAHSFGAFSRLVWSSVSGGFSYLYQ